MDKARPIVALLHSLDTNLGKDYFEDVDYWEADWCAIGLKREDKLIYISIDHKEVHAHPPLYYIEFEIVDKTTGDNIKTVKSLKDIPLENVLNEVQAFFIK